MLILLLLLIIIIIIILNNLNASAEYFNNTTQQKCNCLKKSQIINKNFNRKAYVSNNWHLRFPYMVSQRYSYDDTPNGISTMIHDYGILKELPVNIN